MTRYTLGLDLGCNSVGWAMIARDGETFDDGSRIKAGVRVFPEGLDTRKDKVGTPRAQHRRLMRSQRRILRRRRQRRRAVLKLLCAHGLLPRDAQERRTLLVSNPYAPYLLRAKGVNEKLTPYEFGRCLYHLCQRRGFKSNKKIRKTADKPKEDKEEKVTEEKRRSLQAHLKHESITLGQYLAGFVPLEHSAAAHSETTGRKAWLRNHDHDTRYHHHTTRQMYKDEFDTLWATQSKQWAGDMGDSSPLTDSLRQEIERAIFDQRRVWWPLDSIGRCRLTGETRCPKAHWLGQEFRLLQEINNLSILNVTTGEVRPLSAEERSTLASSLRTCKSKEFTAIGKVLHLGKEWQFRSFETDARRPGLNGNVVEAVLRSGFLASWYDALAGERREEVYETLVAIDQDEKKNRAYGIDEASLRKKGHSWGLTPEQIDELVALQETLPDGYHEYSLAAIRKIVPFLAEGMTIDKAVAAAGFTPPERATEDSLPPVNKVDEYLTNPRVRRSLTEARKVVNLLIARHGKPDETIIEMAREMKQSRKHRQEILDKQRTLADLNEDAAAELQGMGQPVNRESRLRYRLWKEMLEAGKAVCRSPYSERKIERSELFGPNVDIDHILPRCRTLDDSFVNKVLCFRDENAAKGNRTPCEWLGKDSAEYKAVLERVKGLPLNKRRKFQQETVSVEGCIDRQLKETQHTAKAAVAYLGVLGRPVRCVQGYTTAPLRRYWGLNKLLGGETTKNRFDHRHHAIDAIVIALTTHTHLHRLCNRIESGQETDFPLPWEGFREDVRNLMEALAEGTEIAVSHRPSRKVAAPLHKETGYGPVRDRWGNLVKGVYTTRKKLTDLTHSVINSDDAGIADPEIRRVIRATCVKEGLAAESTAEKGWICDGTYYTVKPKPGKKLAAANPRMKSGVPIKRVRIRVRSNTAELVRTDGGREAKFVVPKEKHHLAIYRKPDGNWLGVAVSAFEAHHRLREQQALFKKTGVRKDLVVNRGPVNGAEFVTCLCIDDMVRLKNLKTGQRDLYRVVSASVDAEPSGRPDMWFRYHTVADLPDSKESAKDERLKELREELLETERAVRVRNWPELMDERAMEKVSVSPIGEMC